MAEKVKDRKAVSVPGSEKNPKAEALAVAMSQIEKQYGKGSIMRLGATDKLNAFNKFLAKDKTASFKGLFKLARE